jgi:hypothetical protein
MKTSYAWFRMYTDFLEDAKMLTLAFEDQRHFIGVLALKCAGTIDQDCEMRVMDRLVGQKLWIDLSAVVEVKRRLIEAGLIDQHWQPLAWDKRQMRSDHDVTGAERQKRYRENQRNALRNGAVTLPEENRIDKNREEESKHRRSRAFTRPTIDDVAAYCAERGNRINPQAFLDYYESNGWRVGKTAMKDWQAAVRTWEKRDETNQRTRERTFDEKLAELRRLGGEAEF